MLTAREREAYVANCMADWTAGTPPLPMTVDVGRGVRIALGFPLLSQATGRSGDRYGPEACVPGESIRRVGVLHHEAQHPINLLVIDLRLGPHP
jgi:hypothetical protein